MASSPANHGNSVPVSTEPAFQLKRKRRWRRAYWAGDNELLVVGPMEGRIGSLDLQSRKMTKDALLFKKYSPPEILAIGFSPSGRFSAVVLNTLQVILCDGEKDDEYVELAPPSAGNAPSAFSCVVQRVKIAVANDGSLLLHSNTHSNLSTGSQKPVYTFRTWVFRKPRNGLPIHFGEWLLVPSHGMKFGDGALCERVLLSSFAHTILGQGWLITCVSIFADDARAATLPADVLAAGISPCRLRVWTARILAAGLTCDAFKLMSCEHVDISMWYRKIKVTSSDKRWMNEYTRLQRSHFFPNPGPEESGERERVWDSPPPTIARWDSEGTRLAVLLNYESHVTLVLQQYMSPKDCPVPQVSVQLTQYINMGSINATAAASRVYRGSGNISDMVWINSGLLLALVTGNGGLLVLDRMGNPLAMTLQLITINRPLMRRTSYDVPVLGKGRRGSDDPDSDEINGQSPPAHQFRVIRSMSDVSGAVAAFKKQNIDFPPSFIINTRSIAVERSRSFRSWDNRTFSRSSQNEEVPRGVFISSHWQKPWVSVSDGRNVAIFRFPMYEITSIVSQLYAAGSAGGPYNMEIAASRAFSLALSFPTESLRTECLRKLGQCAKGMVTPAVDIRHSRLGIFRVLHIWQSRLVRTPAQIEGNRSDAKLRHFVGTVGTGWHFYPLGFRVEAQAWIIVLDGLLEIAAFRLAFDAIAQMTSCKGLQDSVVPRLWMRLAARVWRFVKERNGQPKDCTLDVARMLVAVAMHRVSQLLREKVCGSFRLKKTPSSTPETTPTQQRYKKQQSPAQPSPVLGQEEPAKVPVPTSGRKTKCRTSVFVKARKASEKDVCTRAQTPASKALQPGAIVIYCTGTHPPEDPVVSTGNTQNGQAQSGSAPSSGPPPISIDGAGVHSPNASMELYRKHFPTTPGGSFIAFPEEVVSSVQESRRRSSQTERPGLIVDVSYSADESTDSRTRSSHNDTLHSDGFIGQSPAMESSQASRAIERSNSPTNRTIKKTYLRDLAGSLNRVLAGATATAQPFSTNRMTRRSSEPSTSPVAPKTEDTICKNEDSPHAQLAQHQTASSDLETPLSGWKIQEVGAGGNVDISSERSVQRVAAAASDSSGSETLEQPAGEQPISSPTSSSGSVEPPAFLSSISVELSREPGGLLAPAASTWFTRAGSGADLDYLKNGDAEDGSKDEFRGRFFASGGSFGHNSFVTPESVAEQRRDVCSDFEPGCHTDQLRSWDGSLLNDGVESDVDCGEPNCVVVSGARFGSDDIPVACPAGRDCDVHSGVDHDISDMSAVSDETGSLSEKLSSKWRGKHLSMQTLQACLHRVWGETDTADSGAAVRPSQPQQEERMRRRREVVSKQKQEVGRTVEGDSIVAGGRQEDYRPGVRLLTVGNFQDNTSKALHVSDGWNWMDLKSANTWTKGGTLRKETETRTTFNHVERKSSMPKKVGRKVWPLLSIGGRGGESVNMLDDDEKGEVRAAREIQRAYLKYILRRNVRRMTNEAAVQVSKIPVVEVERSTSPILCYDAEENAGRRMVAAVRIQRVMRGLIITRRVRRRTAAAECIQMIWRVALAKMLSAKAKRNMIENKAATCLQKVVRGWIGRSGARFLWKRKREMDTWNVTHIRVHRQAVVLLEDDQDLKMLCAGLPAGGDGKHPFLLYNGIPDTPALDLKGQEASVSVPHTDGAFAHAGENANAVLDEDATSSVLGDEFLRASENGGKESDDGSLNAAEIKRLILKHVPGAAQRYEGLVRQMMADLDAQMTRVEEGNAQLETEIHLGRGLSSLREELDYQARNADKYGDTVDRSFAQACATAISHVVRIKKIRKDAQEMKTQLEQLKLASVDMVRDGEKSETSQVESISSATSEFPIYDPEQNMR